MRRWILLLCVLTLSLGSCNLPKLENAARPMGDPVILEVSPSPKETITASMTPSTTPAPARPTLTPTEIITAPSDPPLTAGEAVLITTIDMLNETSGWAIGQQPSQHDHILRTFDGGETWIDISPPEPLPEFEGSLLRASAHFLDSDHAWVVYTQSPMRSIESARIWYTSNGGIDWRSSAPLSLTGLESFFDPAQFVFLDSQQGWLLVHVDAGMSHDYSELFTTVDGGLHWQRVTDPYTDGIQSLHNTGLAFADAQFGWVTKDNLGVLQMTFLEQTTDGGYSWEILSLPAPSDFDWDLEFNRCITSNPTFLSQQAGVVLVHCIFTVDQNTFETGTLSYIYTTPDRGKTWQYAKMTAPIESLFFLDEQIGWAFGRDIFSTTDGGLRWVTVKTVNWDGQFSFIDSNHGWAVARDDEEIALVETLDGGLTWQILETSIQP